MNFSNDAEKLEIEKRFFPKNVVSGTQGEGERKGWGGGGEGRLRKNTRGKILRLGIVNLWKWFAQFSQLNDHSWYYIIAVVPRVLHERSEFCYVVTSPRAIAERHLFRVFLPVASTPKETYFYK